VNIISNIMPRKFNILLFIINSPQKIN